MQSRQRAFTLVELLVVISIIAVLAGLALPALSGAMNTAKKAKANSMINQLKVAITAFNTEYGTWPNSANETDDGKLEVTTAYHVLVGASADTTSEQAGNTRDISFMEFAAADLDNSTAPTMFVDPWYKGSSTANKQQQIYSIYLDYDYNNQISVPDISNTGGNATINAGAAIWDPGVPSKNTVNTDQTKFLHSW